jgi:hypothetical protein
LVKVFALRESTSLGSIAKFKIQDLIDLYKKDWKSVIYGERIHVDEEGFQYKYVPKEKIIS